MADLASGARVYSRFNLSLYDLIVLWFTTSYMWKCSTSKVLLPLFMEYFSNNHLDIGVATGSFPATALKSRSKEMQNQKIDGHHRITLIDLNPNSLAAAKARILSQAPETTVTCYQADVLAPPPVTLHSDRFQSISMMNLLHCVPGPASRKIGAFRNYKTLMTDNGTLFGCTILGPGHTGSRSPPNLRRGWLYWQGMLLFNFLGWFDNWGDERDIFDTGLRAEFRDVQTWVVGSMLLFRATGPLQ
jgi:hypothetical protein